MVAEAASGKSKHGQLQAEHRATARARREQERLGPEDKEKPFVMSEHAPDAR